MSGKSVSKQNRKRVRRTASRRLAFESLQSRELMAANVFAFGNQVAIYADPGGGAVYVTELSGNRISVTTGGPYGHVFSKSDIQQIFFAGSSKTDIFINATDLPSVAYGGLGDDYLYGGSGMDRFYGQNGSDRLYGGSGRDTLLGGIGDDYLRGQAGHDTLSGGDGEDQLYGDDGRDTLRGGGNRDLLFGGDDRDDLYGDDGDDYLRGDAENDYLEGGRGNDTLDGGTGVDRLYGGEEDDTLYGGYGNDMLYGERGHDKLYGGADDDQLFGGAGEDRLDGWNGNDKLYGGPDNDRLYGAGGNDSLFGGMGYDFLNGGAGSDRFLTQAYQFYTVRTPPVVTHYTTNLDIVEDQREEDVQIHFRDGEETTRTAEYRDQNGNKSTGPITWNEGRWTEEEIQVVDSALATLHDATGNAALLRRADGAELTFERVGSANVDAITLAWNQNGKLVFTDKALAPDIFAIDQYEDARGIVFHEIGHNWDSPSEFGLINTFRSLSGWTTSKPANAEDNGYKSTEYNGTTWWYKYEPSDFATDYARSSPFEDFADTFRRRIEEIHYRLPSTADPSYLLDDKLQLIDDLITQLT